MGYNYIPGSARYNGSVRAGTNSLTLGMDVYTVTTSVNITPMAVGPFADVTGSQQIAPSAADYHADGTAFVAGAIPNDFSQNALDRLVEIVSQRGQPVVMGIPVNANNLWTFRFSIEHGSAWGVTPMATPTVVPLLVAAIQRDGIDFGFNTDASLTVTVSNS